MSETAHNVRAEFSRTHAPIGTITRGTTNTNRLRRADRWLHYNPQARQLLLGAHRPVAVDVGYGASHTTTCEWARWLRRTRADIRVVGLEIHPDRVLPPRDGVEFALGGFELAGLRPHVVRAFNVLRQYDVAQVHDAWSTVCSRLAPGGLFIEGTCDEIGRRACWVMLTADGPQWLTLAWHPGFLDRPSTIAERLPKALIHNNTPGHAIHDVLAQADRAWDIAAPISVYGTRARWRAARDLLAQWGMPMMVQRRPTRDNVLTVPWSLVAD